MAGAFNDTMNQSGIPFPNLSQQVTQSNRTVFQSARIWWSSDRVQSLLAVAEEIDSTYLRVLPRWQKCSAGGNNEFYIHREKINKKNSKENSNNDNDNDNNNNNDNKDTRLYSYGEKKKGPVLLFFGPSSSMHTFGIFPNSLSLSVLITIAVQ